MFSPIVEASAFKPQTKPHHKSGPASAAKNKGSKSEDIDKKHFPLGVMAGDAKTKTDGQTHAVLWTKYVHKAGKLSVHIRQVDSVLPDSKLHDWKTKPVKASEIRGMFVHHTAKKLKPGTQYKYKFIWADNEGNSGSSPVGLFWTPIAPDSLDPVVFGGTACTHQNAPRLKLTNRNMRHVAHHKSGLQFFVHLGDHVYCDAQAGAENPAATANDYRNKYKKAYKRPGLKALHRAFGMYNTWDDHEVFNNWSGNKETKRRHAPGPLKNKNIKSIMRAGEQSFYDHHPIDDKHRSNPAGKEKKKKHLWRSFKWGSTLEIFILDCRNERGFDDKNKNKHKDKSEDRHYISGAQEKWLIRGIQKSKAVFKFVLNSRPIGYLPYKSKKLKKKDFPKHKDYTWTAPWVVEQRDRILSETAQTPGVWWLSGDVHYGTTGWVDRPKPKVLVDKDEGEVRVFMEPDGRWVGNKPWKHAARPNGEVLMGPGGQWVAKTGSDDWDEMKKGKILNIQSATLLNKDKDEIRKKLKAGKLKDVDKKKTRFGFATLHSNYVVIQANPVVTEVIEEGVKKKDASKSTLVIEFWGGNHHKVPRLLNRETRDYSGNLIPKKDSQNS